jgi:hypothetical protein
MRPARLNCQRHKRATRANKARAMLFMAEHAGIVSDKGKGRVPDLLNEGIAIVPYAPDDWR